MARASRKLEIKPNGDIAVGGVLFLASPQLERLRPYLHKRGHRRTFSRRTSIYLPGPVKNALMSRIERHEGNSYETPWEHLVEHLKLKRRDGAARRKR